MIVVVDVIESMILVDDVIESMIVVIESMIVVDDVIKLMTVVDDVIKSIFGVDDEINSDLECTSDAWCLKLYIKPVRWTCILDQFGTLNLYIRPVICCY